MVTVHERIFMGVIAVLITILLGTMTFIGSQNTSRLDRIEGKQTDFIRENTRVQYDIIGRLSKVEALLETWNANYFPEEE